MRIVLSLIAFLVLVGCSASGPLYTERNNINTPAPGKALVYVYRIDTIIGSGVSAHLLDDGKDVGAVNVGGYFVYEADPGVHTLFTETTGIDEPTKIEMVAGQTYYLRIDYEPGTWTGTFTVKLLLEDQALPELKLTRYQGT
ncbi:DUF2846 domain-containing protein [Sneathiella chungangensis]|uniref:DUF2846 domain-containing protein n=1 Tax=Sneathiella chungangensis TaxID=1418234 RepID=A0A845M8B6_9PROT|nr:DUF2846 domain-containing protein [Sneathiella chungangensis]MZR20809.1 DUF2846 domain-containing protein [Sneathiella chungangensis]